MQAYYLDGKGNHLFRSDGQDIAPAVFWAGVLSVVQEYRYPYDLNHTPFGRLSE